MTRELSTDVELLFLPNDSSKDFTGASIMFSSNYGGRSYSKLSLRVVPINIGNPLYHKKGYRWFAEINEAGKTCLANGVFREDPERAEEIYEDSKDELIELFRVKEPISKDFFESVIKH